MSFHYDASFLYLLNMTTSLLLLFGVIKAVGSWECSEWMHIIDKDQPSDPRNWQRLPPICVWHSVQKAWAQLVPAGSSLTLLPAETPPETSYPSLTSHKYQRGIWYPVSVLSSFSHHLSQVSRTKDAWVRWEMFLSSSYFVMGAAVTGRICAAQKTICRSWCLPSPLVPDCT